MDFDEAVEVYFTKPIRRNAFYACVFIFAGLAMLTSFLLSTEGSIPIPCWKLAASVFFIVMALSMLKQSVDLKVARAQLTQALESNSKQGNTGKLKQ